MSDRSQGETALVQFSERLTNSAAFGTLFREGMDLVEETAAYLDGVGRTEAKALDRSVSLTYATESMRLTTRLMQLASWLLLHRAVKEGEMTLTQANREKTKVKLSAADPGPNDMVEKLPQQLQDLIARSMTLQAKVRRLDTTIHAPVTERAAIGNPLVPQLNRLKAAFERYVGVTGTGSSAAPALSRRVDRRRENDPALLTPFSILLVLSAAFMHASWNALLRGGADRAQSMLIMNVTVGIIGLAMMAFAGLPSAASARLCGRLGSHSSRLQCAVGADVSQRRSRRDLSGGARLFAGAGRARRQPVRRRMDEPDRRCRHRPRLYRDFHAGGRPGALGKSRQPVWRPMARPGKSGRPARDEFAGGAGDRRQHCRLHRRRRHRRARLRQLGRLHRRRVRVLSCDAAVVSGARPARDVRGAVAEAGKAASGGAISLAAYGAIIWAMQASPMGAVSALRETSVVFAALLGAAFLGERLTVLADRGVLHHRRSAPPASAGGFRAVRKIMLT